MDAIVDITGSYSLATACQKIFTSPLQYQLVDFLNGNVKMARDRTWTFRKNNDEKAVEITGTIYLWLYDVNWKTTTVRIVVLIVQY